MLPDGRPNGFRICALLRVYFEISGAGPLEPTLHRLEVHRDGAGEPGEVRDELEHPYTALAARGLQHDLVARGNPHRATQVARHCDTFSR